MTYLSNQNHHLINVGVILSTLYSDRGLIYKWYISILLIYTDFYIRIESCKKKLVTIDVKMKVPTFLNVLNYQSSWYTVTFYYW